MLTMLELNPLLHSHSKN